MPEIGEGSLDWETANKLLAESLWIDYRSAFCDQLRLGLGDFFICSRDRNKLISIGYCNDAASRHEGRHGVGPVEGTTEENFSVCSRADRLYTIRFTYKEKKEWGLKPRSERFIDYSDDLFRNIADEPVIVSGRPFGLDYVVWRLRRGKLYTYEPHQDQLIDLLRRKGEKEEALLKLVMDFFRH